jgi:1,4-dihydroxy-6-naphthoate synthase
MNVRLGFTPCPNDCFMFDAIVHQRIDLEGLSFDFHLADVEALNREAFVGAAGLSKLSYHAAAHVADRYAVLDSGSALGRNCGPLLISKRPVTREQVARGGLRIAIPGRYTTANLLLRLAFPQAAIETRELVFSEIEGALLRDEADAGVIIHENRFTYEAKGLRKILDLGEFWEGETGMPIPLGAIVVNRSLPLIVQHAANRVIRRSVEYAFAHPGASREYVRAHAQEMDEDVMRRHIALYVNDYSIDLGAEGRRAVRVLFERAATADVIAAAPSSIFIAPGAERSGS